MSKAKPVVIICNGYNIPDETAIGGVEFGSSSVSEIGEEHGCFIPSMCHSLAYSPITKYGTSQTNIL